MNEQRDQPPHNADLSRHILPTAATMVGICTTLVGLVKLNEARSGSSRVDEYSGLAALLFLASALCSYFSIRAKHRRAGEWFERVADLFFVAGLVGLSVIAVLFAYELI